MRVKRFGFSVLPCGCLASRYHEAGTTDVLYIEERGGNCIHHMTGLPATTGPATMANLDPSALDAVEPQSVWPRLPR